MTTATAERDIFAPQKLPGMRSGLALAIAAHVLLIVAIAWSVRWKSSEPEGVEAELWAAVPQAAAPRVEAPQPQPQPQPRPAPTPPVVQPAPPTPVQQDAQIAIERERAAREKARQEELQRAEAAKKAADLKKQEEAKKLEAERQRLADEAEKKKLAEQAKKDEARQAAIREANLKRMMKEAGSSDDPLASGNAARTAGPSAGYAGRIKARIKPNIVLTASIDGNPLATVRVRVAPDGTIVGKQLVKSSGSAAWDDSVLRAIDKTEVLPKDTDGTVPPTMDIDFRPRD
jgi:colicin import membrane protein